MPRYTVNKRYSAMYNAVRLDYIPPAEVDLPEAQADWVNRDCPGTLTLAEVEPVAEPAPSTAGTAVGEDSTGAAAAADPVPDGSAQVILDWVAGDADRAGRALEAELAKGDTARTTLVAALEKLTKATQDRSHRPANTRTAAS